MAGRDLDAPRVDRWNSGQPGLPPETGSLCVLLLELSVARSNSFGLVIVCYGTSRYRLLDHVIFFMVIFYGYMLQSMDCTCMSTFSIRPFLFGLHSFEWLMLQSTIPHALLPSLLRGLLGLPLFLTSAFYFHSSNKPFYLKYSLHLKVFYLLHSSCRR